MMQFGLIGEKLSHSFSKRIHERLGYEYELREVAKNDIDEFFLKREFCGINVTIPYKKTALMHCDELSEAARAIGCVNCVVRRKDGSLFGDNTDIAGFLYLIRDICVADKNTLILGSGGTSLTVREALSRRGAASIAVASRAGDINYGNIYERCGNAQIIVNTTPVGMYPKCSAAPVALQGFDKLESVIDVVYNPLRSRLVQEASTAGLVARGGLEMLVAQAVAAAELFCGKDFGEQIVGQIYSELMRELQNIVIIGMPGSGKSTVGKMLAEQMKRRFVDIDAEIETRAQKRIPDIFAEDGEGAFRNIESEVCADICAENGLVIATGGGAVLRTENVKAMRSNGRVYLLKRSIENLAVSGRPLSKNADTLKKLEKERAAAYSAAADCEILNEHTVGAAAKKILDEYNSYK